MEIWFHTLEEVKQLQDIVDYDEHKLELAGWSCDEGEVVIKDWSLINYKSSIKIGENFWGSKRVHLNDIIFENCTFKDVTFAGAVPLDGCEFIKCSFENCIFADHIRWTKFIGCKFKFCMFSGYFHGSKFSKSCKFEKIGLNYYGDNPFTPLKTIETIIRASKKNEKALMEYFYPEHMEFLYKFKIGKPYLFKAQERWEKDDSIFSDFLKNLKTFEIDGVKHYKDIVKKHSIELTHFSPNIRVCGSLHIELKDCLECDDRIQTRNVMIG